MQSQDEIMLDYSNAINQVEELEDVARELFQQIEDITNCRNDVVVNWQGSNADAMAQRMLEEVEQFIEIYKKLTSASSAIREEIERIKNADLEALRIIQQQLSLG